MSKTTFYTLSVCAVVFCSILLQKSVLCHPTVYKNVIREKACYEPAPVKIYSWHIHVVYDNEHIKKRKAALNLLELFKKTFGTELGAPCNGTFHQGRLCIFEPRTGPYGPFPVSQWAIFTPIEHFASKVPWFMQHRVTNGTELDVLLHPNSGCEVEDHTWWTFWGGQKWRLDTDRLVHDSPYPWPHDTE